MVVSSLRFPYCYALLFISMRFRLVNSCFQSGVFYRTTARDTRVGRHSTVLTRWMASVSGIVYEGEGPTIKLFTKEGCTLCDKVKDVLLDIRESYPHSLILMDITDRCYEQWYEKYKFDIPVLHINGRYWTKHRLSRSQAIQGIQATNEGTFRSPKGEPNAAAVRQHAWTMSRDERQRKRDTDEHQNEQ